MARIIFCSSVSSSLWSLGVVALASAIVKGWKGVPTLPEGGKVAKRGSALSKTLFALSFFAGELLGLGILWYATSLSTIEKLPDADDSFPLTKVLPESFCIAHTRLPFCRNRQSRILGDCISDRKVESSTTSYSLLIFQGRPSEV